MSALSNIKQAYFAGIGGIGMSALAKLLHKRGIDVCGYDRSSSDITAQMEQMGIRIHYEDNSEWLASFLRGNRQESLVVLTPAIPAGFGELKTLSAAGFMALKRAELLGMIADEYKSMAVAGTHGKTTTSCMMAWLMQGHPKGAIGVLGGVSTNFNDNMVLPDEEAEWLITEADEFDRSFLYLNPDIAVITSTDADHLDIYRTHEALLKAFGQFARRVKPGGHLLVHDRVGRDAQLRVSTYGAPSSQYHAANIRIQGITYHFDFIGPDIEIKNLQLSMPGAHNVENAVAACAAAYLAGLSPEKIKERLTQFTGVKRRFEFIIYTPDFVYIDDYAHHPREIEAFISGVKALFPGKRITAVFQPHLYTRTRDFASGFVESLSLADEVILLDIYPAREFPIEGVDSARILNDLKAEKKILSTKGNLIESLEALNPEILLTIGAGDIDRLVPILKDYYQKKGGSNAES